MDIDLNHRLSKICSQHGRESPPEGGIDLGPGKWLCGQCWKDKLANRKPKYERIPDTAEV